MPENLRETLKEASPSEAVNKMLDRYDLRVQQGLLEKTYVNDVFKSVGTGIKMAKERLNTEGVLDTFTEDEIAKISNPWLAWDGSLAQDLFGDADSDTATELKVLLQAKDTANPKQDRALRYARQVWRTEMTSFLVKKLSENSDPKASDKLLAMMAAQKISGPESLPMQALTSAMHLDNKLTSRTSRTQLASEMAESTIGVLDLKGLNDIQPIKSMKILVGGEMLAIPLEMAKSLTFKNVVFEQADQENRVYAQLENGCEGNLVIMEIGDKTDEDNEEDQAEDPIDPNSEVNNQGDGSSVPIDPSAMSADPEPSIDPEAITPADPLRDQISSIDEMLKKTAYTFSTETSNKIDAIVLQKAASDPIRLTYDQAKKTFKATLKDITFEGPDAIDLAKRTINEQFTQETTTQAIEEYKDTGTLLIADADETAPFKIYKTAIFFSKYPVWGSVVKGSDWPFTGVDLPSVSVRLNKAYREAKGIPEEAPKEGLEGKLSEIKDLLKTTNYHVQQVAQDNNRITILSNEDQMGVVYDPSTKTYRLSHDLTEETPESFSGPDPIPLIKNAINATYAIDYIKQAVTNFIQTNKVLSSDHKTDPFLYGKGISTTIQAHYLGSDNGLGVMQPKFPFPDQVDWEKIVAQMNTSYEEQTKTNQENADLNQLEDTLKSKGYTLTKTPDTNEWTVEKEGFTKMTIKFTPDTNGIEAIKQSINIQYVTANAPKLAGGLHKFTLLPVIDEDFKEKPFYLKDNGELSVHVNHIHIPMDTTLGLPPFELPFRNKIPPATRTSVEDTLNEAYRSLKKSGT